MCRLLRGFVLVWGSFIWADWLWVYGVGFCLDVVFEYACVLTLGCVGTLI